VTTGKPRTYEEKDVFKVADNGPDGKGGRKQKWHTFQHGMQLMVCGDSRNFYSPWEVPVEMRKDPAKREVKREALGSANKISYADALSEHLKIQGNIEKGIYPDARKKGPGRRAKGETFESYGTRVVKGWADQRKNMKDAKGMKNIIPRYCEKINPVPIADVSTTNVIEVLEPIWHAKPGMAAEVRALISRVCRAAGHEELRAKTDPATVEAIRAVLGPQKKKKGFIRGPMKHVPPLEMPEFMVELRQRDEQTPRAVETTILTNMRTGTMRGMALDQLLLTEAAAAKVKSLYHSGPRWIVPSGLMKVDDDNHDFVLPLVPRAVEIIQRQIAYLEERYDGGRKVDLIWPGDVIPDEPVEIWPGRFSIDQPISENTMRDWVVDTMGRKATPHGFRASFQTWAENELQEDGETMKFAPDAISYCMAHNPGDKVKRAYRRNRLWKPRVGIMNAWTRFLGPVRGKLKAVA
jgi:integrase